MSKGSNPRPREISGDTWRKNYERVFAQPKAPDPPAGGQPEPPAPAPS